METSRSRLTRRMVTWHPWVERMNAVATRLIRQSLVPLGRLRARLRGLPLGRAFWLLMGLGHAPALIGAWRSLAESGFAVEPFGGCIILTLSMLFFALKLRDVPCLRFRTDRRSWIALCMVVALLHTNAILPDGDPTIAPQCTTLVVTTWLSTQLPVTRRMLVALPTRIAAAVRRGDPVTRSADTVWLDAFRPRCWVLALHVFRLRAPPA